MVFTTYARSARGRPAISAPGIADQRLARPEQQHQQDAEHAHDSENRLVQQHPDDAVPQPGGVALDPGPECRLAGLIDVVPELAEPGEAQGLVGHPAGAVIDHEDETAGQQQQPDKSEKTADHPSPSISRAPNAASHYRSGGRNSTSSAPYRHDRHEIPYFGMAGRR